MLENFNTFLVENFKLSLNDKLLLTVSGGVDSTVMCDLFANSHYYFDIAHCNFHLRGKESDEDEVFVRQLAQKYNSQIHIIHFDTLNYAKTHKMGIEEAARKLRYQWFETLSVAYDFVATAHNSNDQVETLVMNLMRKSGITGLCGIPWQRGKYIRPLIGYTRSQIMEYANSLGITYREDSSNDSDDYLRNKIRHHIIPGLTEIRQNFIESAVESMRLLTIQKSIYLREILSFKQKVYNSETASFDKQKMLEYEDLSVYLYEILKEYHFNFQTVENIVQQLNGQSGKYFYSSTHQILSDREQLYLSERESHHSLYQTIRTIQELMIYFPQSQLCKYSFDFKFEKNANFAYFDVDKIEFPLTLRFWEAGDWIAPFGMKGKCKISDLFIDYKLTMNQKKKKILLCQQKEVLWVPGIRTSSTYAVTASTKYIIYLKNN